MWPRASSATLCLVLVGVAPRRNDCDCQLAGQCAQGQRDHRRRRSGGLCVTRADRPVINESRLGFILADAPKLERNFTLGGTRTRSSDETWEQPWGERRFVRNRFNELRVTLVEKSALGAQPDRRVPRL